ncbi:MAG: hypothetical protein IPK82_40580 [Polyangiaceae bacterium]|nr:hypothetical protein [Polyangiaceae bacterium]
MKRTIVLVLSAFLFAATACCGAPPAAKGPIPPGTPPPEYEAPRVYQPGASTAPAAPTTAAPMSTQAPSTPPPAATTAPSAPPAAGP